MSKRPAKQIVTGLFLLGLGIVVWLNLWWLLLPTALVGAGIYAYTMRRAQGRTVEAVQLGLWGIGLGMLFLLDIFWPGILLLVGISALLRGREYSVAEWTQVLAGRIAQARPGRMRPSRPAQDVTITVEQALPYDSYQPSASKTTKL